MSNSERSIIERVDFQRLFDALRQRGYQLIGPTVSDGVIVYADLYDVSDLPIGWSDEQEAGHYRLQRRNDEALFGYNLGPHAWKRLLHPPTLRLWQARRNDDHFDIVETESKPPKLALIGVRACELHAIQIQDRIFVLNQYVDADYQARRENAFIVAVNCGNTGGSCFCASMQTGPAVGNGHDLALTEVLDADKHYFVVEIGSEQGAAVLAEVPHRVAQMQEIDAAERIVASAAAQMGRQLDTTDLKELIYRNLDHARWSAIANRCLACANCTMVCPTCFCSTVEDVTDLGGDVAERWRKDDSCFSVEFSHIYGGSIRTSTKARYRQWLSHKLASWIDQFGRSGCVGCGRCITWCPVGIDITEEARAIRESEHHD